MQMMHPLVCGQFSVAAGNHPVCQMQPGGETALIIMDRKAELIMWIGIDEIGCQMQLHAVGRLVGQQIRQRMCRIQLWCLIDILHHQHIVDRSRVGIDPIDGSGKLNHNRLFGIDIVRQHTGEIGKLSGCGIEGQPSGQATTTKQFCLIADSRTIGGNKGVGRQMKRESFTLYRI